MQFTTSDGLTLDYFIEGEGHPILCLPGLTRNADDFREFADAYLDKAQIIALTFRGRWPSSFDRDYKNYNPYREGQDTIELLDHLGISKALWLGTSRGGLVTMAMAGKHLDRMAGAVFNDIGPELNMQGLARIVGYLGILPAWRNLDEAARIIQLDRGAEYPDLNFEDWRKLAKRWFRFDENGVSLLYDPKLRDAVLEAGEAWDAWEAFRALDPIPLGIIWGENSDLLTQNEVLKMKENRPSLEVAKVPDRGHVPFLNEPQSLALIDKIFAQSFSKKQDI